MQIPSMGIDVDASAYFNRQLRNLIGPLNQRSGATTEMNRCQTLTLQGMKHQVKIAQGVSDGFFMHTEDTPVFGSGQGSGAEVPNWHSHNETITSTYKEFHKGITMATPDGDTAVEQDVVSFVDDNTLLDECEPTIAAPAEMHQQAAHSLTSWQRIMRITGGAVELPKCYLSVMAYKFDTYSLKKHGRQRGVPRLKTIEELPGTCQLCDDDQ